VPEANLPVFISHLLSRYALCVEYSQVLEEGFIFELAVLFSVMLLNAWIPRKGAKRVNGSTLAMTAFYSVLIFRRRDEPKK
jgi:hypothetical protein